MSKFFVYLLLVIKRTFWGADNISKTLGVISLFVVVGFQFTSLPWEARLGLLTLLVFLGTFNVWGDERRAKEAAKKQLKEIKDKTPSFQVTVSETKRYTIKPILDKYMNEIQNVQQIIDAKRAREAKEESEGAAQATFRIGGLDFSKLSAQLSSALNSSLIPRPETTEEKLERLNNYLAKLNTYEAALERLYKIDLSLTASRSDANIEVWVKADNVTKMVVDDNFAQKHIPAARRNESYGRQYILPPMESFNRLSSKLYPASYADEEGAYSKIANLNAQRPLLVFDEDFYVTTSEKTINLRIKITSQKRNEQQELTVVVPLGNIPVETLQDED